MFTRQIPYTIKNGVTVDVTTAAAQQTGFTKGLVVSISNIGSYDAYINTNSETASATLSMPIFAGETKSPILLSKGTINHIGAGSTTLTVNEITEV